VGRPNLPRRAKFESSRGNLFFEQRKPFPPRGMPGASVALIFVHPIDDALLRLLSKRNVAPGIVARPSNRRPSVVRCGKNSLPMFSFHHQDVGPMIPARRQRTRRGRF